MTKKILIITGSDSDLPTIASSVNILEEFGVNYSVHVASAHRTPERVRALVREGEKKGVQVIIAAAGMAAALPGVIAAETVLPVIGIPIESKALAGVDALFSIAQMPPGIPVASVAIGKAGATNAGILAVEILALKNASLKKKLFAYRKKLARSVTDKNTLLQRIKIRKYIETLNK